MFPSEIDTLQRLRRHRADRAERDLRDARRLAQSLDASIEQARAALQQAREDEVQERAQLLGKHQGQVLSVHDLSAWSSQERKLSAGLVKQQGGLYVLLDEKDVQETAVEVARKQVSQRLREVEKLRELKVLLAQEQAPEQEAS